MKSKKVFRSLLWLDYGVNPFWHPPRLNPVYATEQNIVRFYVTFTNV